MKSITIFALHLGYGGIEKCIANLANDLVDKYNINIISVYKLYEEPAFSLDKRINIRYLINDKPNRNDFLYYLKHFRLISTLKEGIKSIKILYYKKRKTIDAIDSCDSDIIISTRVYLNKLVGLYKNDGVYTIGWEHNYNIDNKKDIKVFTNSVKNLDRVVMVNKTLQEYYIKHFKENNISTIVDYIPNYISDVSKTRTKLNNKNLIAVGRLESCKGFLDLIDVYKLVNFKLDNTSLIIVGDGREKKALVEKIVSNRLSKYVKITGYMPQNDINDLYDKSAIYVMTSLTESFGLVLIEAMSHGLPVVAFSSAQGARSIVKNDYNGYLIDNRNEFEMADIICDLLNDKEKLKTLSDNAHKTSLEYTSKEVIKKWLNILK